MGMGYSVGDEISSPTEYPTHTYCIAACYDIVQTDDDQRTGPKHVVVYPMYYSERKYSCVLTV